AGGGRGKPVHAAVFLRAYVYLLLETGASDPADRSLVRIGLPCFKQFEQENPATDHGGKCGAGKPAGQQPPGSVNHPAVRSGGFRRDENRGRAGPFSPDQLRIVFECAVGRKRFGVYFVPVQGTASLGWGSVCAGKGNDTGRIAFLFHAAEL